MRRGKILAGLVLAFHFISSAQHIEVQNIEFITDSVSMWASSADPILDDEISLFHVDWNEGYNTGSSGIVTIVGQSFGAGFQGSISGQIGSKIRLENFTSGHLNVNYPVDVTVTMPNDFSFDQGDNVIVNTDFTALDSASLESVYPGGEIMWDLYFQLAASASATICIFGCTTFPIIPTFDTGLITINLVTISTNGASTGGNTGIWFLGPGAPPPWIGGSNPNPPGTEPGVAGWPYAVPLSDNPTGDLFVDWIPWQVYIDAFTLNLPDNELGFSGDVTLPYVETDDTLFANNNMQACGGSTYMNFGVEIFDFLGFILQQFPVPQVEAAGIVLANLAGDIDPLEGTPFEGLVQLEWNFFSASLEMAITNNQCFDFRPKIYGDFQFPFPVEYQIIDTNGVYSAVNSGSVIHLMIGESFSYKFPCFYTDVRFVPTYTIVGMMTNHTWDDIDFSFEMSAFEFGLTIAPFTIVPGFTIPSVCFPVPYPCPSWSCPWCWCTTTVCTPEIVVPPIGYGGDSWGVGPLWEDSIPLGTISYDWFNETWQLPGFNSVVGDTITMKASPLGISNTLTHISCFGGTTGAMAVTTSAVSAATPYTWTLWSDGPANVASSASTTNNYTGLSAGSYQVSVVDGHGCQMFTGGIITEPLALSLSSTKIDKSCNGGANNGSIDLSVTGGTAPYTYSWTGGATTQDISSLNVGTYTVTVTDFKGCTATHTVVIDQPALLGQIGTITHVDCFNASTGSVDVTSFGGTLPYSFSWTSGQSTEDISGVTAGNYTLTVTDGKNCTSTQLYTISQPLAPLALSSTGVDVNCYGNATGSINLTVSGGTAGYTFSWSNATGTVLPNTTEDLANLMANVYTVQVTDSKGCSATQTQAITQPAAPLTSAPTLVHINCFGAATGSVNPGIAGGTAPYTYSWSNGATTPAISSVVAGAYVLNVTDSKGCTASFTYTLNQPQSGLTVALSGTNVLCFGQTTGSVSSTVAGGTPSYSYLWSNGSTAASLSALAAGTYSVTVTDSKGCTATGSTTITQPAAPLAVSAVPTNVNCYGGSTGAVDLTVTGGTAPYGYIWSNGQSLILTTTAQDLTSLTANTYSVQVTDNNGCQAALTQGITQPAAPLALSGTVNDVNCFGLNDGAIDITVTGGTAGYTYNWSNGTVLQDPSAIVAGNYTVVVTDALGCTILGSFTVQQPNAALSVSATTTPVGCNGAATGTASSFVTGGTAPYTYLWSTNATTPGLEDLTAGVYTLTVTDVQGCTAFTGAVVAQPANPLAVVINVTEPSCFGYEDGQIVLNITGGTQPYYFNWGNENEILLNNPSETLSDIPAGDYLFRIRDDNGCIIEQIVTVGQPTILTVSHVVTDALCYGDSTGMIDVTVSGATPPYTYQWSNGMTTEDAVNIPAGLYNYQVTDNQGCEYRNEALVGQPDAVQINYTVTGVSCIDQTDGEIQVSAYGGIAPYSYSWSNGATTPVITDLAPGLYTLTLSDDHSCVSAYDIYVDPSTVACVGIPNTFSPNGDNYNDTWYLENIELYPNAVVKIFNKWGNELYSTSGTYTPWDGTDNGKPLPSEVYYYIITLGNPENDQYTGTVTIVR